MRVCRSLLLTISLVSPCSFFGQSTNAALTGAVDDPSKAVIAGARITAINTETGVKSSTTTNNIGAYALPGLIPGTYRIEVDRQGFKGIIQPGLVLHVQDVVQLNFHMALGSMTETVTVEASGMNINTTDASVSTIVDRKFVENLPLNGRSFQSLILLAPGVVAMPTDATHPGEFSVNGQRQNANYFTVDGVSANTGVSTNAPSWMFSQQANGSVPGTTALGTTASMVSVDALEEFKIQTSTYSAEYGREPGGQIQLVTRSGTNQFHGTAFEYLRNDVSDAQNYFNSQIEAVDPSFKKPHLRQNQFGGAVGGPIMMPRLYNGHNKTFFFFSYEGQRLVLPVVTTGQQVPSLRLRKEVASALQPFLNAFPQPTGPEILVGANNPYLPIDPVTNPAVPSGAAPFDAGYSSPSSVDAYSIRVDHTVNSKLSLFGRYSNTPSSSLTRYLNQLTGNVQDARSGTLGATLSITPRINNEFRFNYSSDQGKNSASMDTFGGAVPVTLSQLVSGYAGRGVINGSMNINFGINGFSLYLGNPVDNYSRQFDTVDNLSWAIGTHQLKFGVDWRRLSPIYGSPAYSQALYFYSEEGLVNGTADNLYQEADRAARPIYENYSLYAQDDWRLGSRLNLSLGVRWDLNPPPYDASGFKPLVLTGIEGTNVSHVGISPSNAPFYKTFKRAFAPRIGLAYQLNRASGKETVLRGGFGIFYDLGNGSASNVFGNYPYFNYNYLSSVPYPLAPGLVQPPPLPPVPTQLTALPTDSAYNYFALDPNLKLPYTLQWNVALEQSLGHHQSLTLSYVASAARQLTTTWALNNPTDPFDPSTRPNPNVGTIQYTTNGPTSNYQSLQIQFKRQLSRGLEILANYSWSHAIDEISNEVDSLELARGDANFDVRHNLSTAVTYDLPGLRFSASRSELVTKFLKGTTTGWSVDSIFVARTGVPLDLTVPGYNSFFHDGTPHFVRPDVVVGEPFWIEDSSVAGGERLNPAAFVAPPENPGLSAECGCYVPARQGTLGRNAIELPGIYQWNMAVRRQFKLTERLSLQTKAEAFNVLNHPLFGSYNNYAIGNSLLGQPQAMLANSMGVGGLNPLYQTGGPRSMQLSLRLTF